jgi:hypothetical protein
MQRMKSAKRRRRPRSQAARAPLPLVIVRTEEKPIRGVKLKHVSAFTMLVAVLCLFAYWAGRVDVSAATSVYAASNAVLSSAVSSRAQGQ